MQDLFWMDVRDLRTHQDAAMALLSKERQMRAARLRTEDDRLRVMAAGLLLCKVFGAEAEEIQYTEHGKPYLPNGAHFSISHGGDLAVLAVSDRPVGVDVEACARKASPAVQKKTLTENERRWLAESGTFAYLWTRKESVMKADGRGLALTPNSFDVLCERVFSYTLSGFELCDHCIAIAAENPAPFTLQEVSLAQLL
ncbi:MAG: 4'-phosphopantetheinyl transferase superfamily protein [Oscillospiraceae bacterium]|nr:4'-phosphopantetheinyl transferase superfamily protein [Oscillospiraceae bacterium]